MDYGQFQAQIWVFGWAIVMYLFHRNATRKRLHQLDLIHKERLHAIDKGVPYPELPPYEPEEPAAPVPTGRPASWFRAAGALSITGGSGLLAALMLMKDRNWPVALILIFLGAGFLLHYRYLRAGDGK